MSIPENAILQYSTLQGNINHQGVLTANVNGTPILDGFPVTNTGGSIGTYQHLGIDGQSNLKTDFLNVSGTQDGGFHFWTANSSQSPQLITELNTTGLKIDHSVAGGATLINLPPIIVGQPTQVIFNYPPALDTFGIQYGVYTNPIQVLFNAGSFTTGTTYYGQASNAQTLIIRTTTNPSDPPLDCSVFTYNQVPFAFVSGVGPSITQTCTLGDDLTLIHDTNISVLTPVDLTIGPSMGANSNIDAFAYHATNGDYYSEFSSSGFVITDGVNNRQHLAYAYSDVYQNGSKSTQILSPLTDNDNLVFASQGTSSTIVMKTKDNDPFLSLDDGVDFAVLTKNDLTFNSVSLPTTVSTNKTQISNLTILQKSIYNQYIAAGIYADGRPPIAPPSVISQTYAYTPSWYFKNTTAGYKINWYIGATQGMTVADILGMYIAFFNGNNTNKDNAPFLNIYTTPTGSGDYAPNFYHSACTYIFDGSITANTRYVEFLNLHSCPIPNYYGANLKSLIQSPISPNPRGPFLQTETVEFFSIGSNSSSSVNSTEFAVSKFGIMMSSGTTEINFFPN
jgi:hypothetical protein